ncbi:MAG: GntR family histidine utilization transcriptional repressor [Planctomycetota bacterium]|jgi:GntR family histidine utilization transcriptional repressor
MKNEIAPLYKQIKNHILSRILSGEWQESQRVPSENELVKEFSISRMTANRALRELTTEGHLVRVTGVGTFVSTKKAQSHLLEIHNIADEVKARGHEYSAKIIKNDKEKAKAEISNQMEIKKDTLVFHSIIVHEEQGQPIQLENRYVNRKIVPGYGKIDFEKTTPAEYLLELAPLQKVEHIVQAIVADAKTRKYLQLEDNEPCLLLKRRTWTDGKIASLALLTHPGSRFQLSGQFQP